MKNKFPEVISMRKDLKRLWEIDGTIPGEETVDMTGWMPPVFSESLAFELANRPWLIPYIVGERSIGGFFSDLWEGIKSAGRNVWSFTKDNFWVVAPAVAGGVAFATSKKARKHPQYVLGPLAVYYLGYALKKWKNPKSALKTGYEGVEKEIQKAMTLPQYEPPPPVKESPVLKNLLKAGSEVAALYIYSKMQENASKNNVPVSQIADQGWAYTARWAPELAKMGLTPEQAFAAVMAATNGAPPDPNTDPWTLLGIPKPTVTVEQETKEERIMDIVKKYWWVFAGGLLLIAAAKEKKVGS